MQLLVICGFLIAFLAELTSQQGRRIPAFTPDQVAAQRAGGRQGPQPQGSQTSTTHAPRQPARARPKPSDDDDDDDDDDEGSSNEKFVCPKQDGLYADPDTCKRFYLCGAWHAYSQSCPPSLYFDDKLKFCTFKTAQLVCGPVDPVEEAKEIAKLSQDGIPHCDPSACHLPDCFCSDEGVTPPGGLTIAQTPQFVLLGFSGAINELVFENYKKVFGYHGKTSTHQTRLNPNGCGIKGTFFINHEYTNYAEIQWLATQGHEIALHSITHRLPEVWWTDSANYSDWAEEIIGMREIIIKFANAGLQTGGVLNRDNVVGLRSPYVKPAGDNMFEMAHDFGLLYDSSIVAPRGPVPYWPFTWDYRQPFDCSNNQNKKGTEEPANNNNKDSGTSIFNGRTRQKRDIEREDDIIYGSKDSLIKKHNKKAYEDYKTKSKSEPKSRLKRNSPYLGRPLKCPTKPYPGLWEIPVNPLFDEYNTCPHADQCVFPSSDETEDSADITDFLLDNFERHYTTSKAPFQLNFHVNWFTSKTKIKALSRMVENVLKNYKDVYFVTYQQLINWLRNPRPINDLNLKCENQTTFIACTRPHTCVVKHYLDNNNNAATVDTSKRTDTRYMPVCHPTSCPQQYPWFGNHAGATKNFRTIMQIVEEASGPDQSKR